MKKRERRGFFHVKCPECGKERTFNTERKVEDIVCSCGCKMPTHAMVPLWINCNCGAIFRYWTNRTDKMFDLECLNCGQPVAVEKRERRYVTIMKPSEY